MLKDNKTECDVDKYMPIKNNNKFVLALTVLFEDFFVNRQQIAVIVNIRNKYKNILLLISTSFNICCCFVV